jgi:hypothetical protein
MNGTPASANAQISFTDHANWPKIASQADKMGNFEQISGSAAGWPGHRFDQNRTVLLGLRVAKTGTQAGGNTLAEVVDAWPPATAEAFIFLFLPDPSRSVGNDTVLFSFHVQRRAP